LLAAPAVKRYPEADPVASRAAVWRPQKPGNPSTAMRTPTAIFATLVAGILPMLALSAFAAGEDDPAAAATPAAEDKTETAEPMPDEDCLQCHGEKDLTKDLPDGKTRSLFVDEKVRKTSIHADLSCTACHEELPEDHADGKPVKPVNCGSCHEDAAKVYDTSIHGFAHGKGSASAATCSSCHGTHDILPAANHNSPIYKLNLSKTCGKCHNNAEISKEFNMRFKEVGVHYDDSIHGRALSEKGLVVAPSCTDCHGAHEITRSVDPSSPVNRANVADTCGKCHVGIEEIYMKSIHGQLLAKGDAKGPVCTDCHTAHDIEKANTAHFKAVSDERCGKCHQDSLTHYRDTYHGKAINLGRPNVASDVAACYDCHGIHNIYPVSDPESTLSKANRQATCAKCHPGATEGFTQYIAHANPLDSSKDPVLYYTFLFMTSLLIGVFAFFGAHTLLWLVRSVWIYRHDSRKYREIKYETQKDDECFTRFTPFDRFLHLLVVTSFLLLVITGMPLKFYYTDWAKTIFDLIGGAAAARALHRFGAIITFLYFALHLVDLLKTCWTNRQALRNPDTGKLELKRFLGAIFGPDSMVPTLEDFKEFWAHQKWFFGKGEKPQFDRWTYFEKFDYFAVFWGIFAIGLSGLIMWFPQFFTTFLPGWSINIALIVHSDEALLAAGFIFTVHFFNTHFRLEKFPMDHTIFSGRISKTEMMHERKLWYDRLVASGKLEQYRIRDEWDRWKGIARPLGFIFFGTGLVLLALIIYAMVTRLLH
jgi:cytochrome b subunit of formate dehydrogenase